MSTFESDDLEDKTTLSDPDAAGQLGTDDSPKPTPNDETQLAGSEPTQLSSEVTAESASASGQTSVPTDGFETAKALLESTTSAERRTLKDRFILDEKVGQGGMGSVYKARDIRKVEAEDKNPFVAIKILTADLGGTSNALTTLQQEAAKTQALAHPNILTVYDFDRDGSTFFMTMELLKGDPLDQLLDLEAPFSRTLTLRYMKDLCAGLEYAHERGLVHADSKPGNVFVTTSGAVKILDFGIARAITKPLGSSRFADNKVSALTPAYATCEMMAGDAPSASDDVYALACVLYYMLTGSHPYGGKSAEAVALEGLSPLQPDVLNDAEWASLAKALSCEREQRPDSVSAFRDSVLAILDDLNESSSNIKSTKQKSLLLMGGLSLTAIAILVAVIATRDSSDAQIDELLAAGDQCLSSNDFDCAAQQLALAASLAVGSDDRVVAFAQLLEKQKIEVTKQKMEVRKQELLVEGRACRSLEDYICMRTSAESILELDPNHAPAVELLSEADQLERAARAESQAKKRNIVIQ